MATAAPTGVRRTNRGTGHSYTIDGVKVPGVTTILRDTMPKDALTNWAAKVTASYAIDRWDELTAEPPSRRLDMMIKAHNQDRDSGARRGTEVHQLATDLVAGREVEVPDELVGHVKSYVEFLDTWEPVPLLVEATVANRSVRYCGTLDLVAEMRDMVALITLKTARSGIWPEAAIQNCAYLHAEVYLTGADELPMAELGITDVFGLHIRADGWELRRLTVGDEVWNFFRHLAWLQRRKEVQRDWVGLEVRP